MLLGPIVWIQKGLIVFGSVLDSPAECEVAPSCLFFQWTHALEQIVSAVMDGTVELEVFALVYCMNQHCKCFPSSSSFVVFFLHVARMLPLELLTLCPSDSICTNLSACTTQACVKTAVYPSAFAMSPSTITLPTALQQQTVKMCSNRLVSHASIYPKGSCD